MLSLSVGASNLVFLMTLMHVVLRFISGGSGVFPLSVDATKLVFSMNLMLVWVAPHSGALRRTSP